MKIKKIISLLLTVCMVMGIITPAFAEDGTITEVKVDEYYVNTSSDHNYNADGTSSQGNLNKTFDIAAGGIVETVEEGYTVDNNYSTVNNEIPTNVTNNTELNKFLGPEWLASFHNPGEFIGGIQTNNGTVNNNCGSILSNNGYIENSYGKIYFNNLGATIENVGSNNKSGDIMSNYGKIVNFENKDSVMQNNYGVVHNSSGTIVENFALIAMDSPYKSSVDFGYIEYNNGTTTTNNGIIWNNLGNGVTTNLPYDNGNNWGTGGIVFHNSGIIFNFEDSFGNKGVVVFNTTNDTDGTKVYNKKGKIINNYGTITESHKTTPYIETHAAGTIDNNYGTVTFEQFQDSNGIVKNNYGKLENAIYDSTLKGYVDGGTDGKTLYGVTVATNRYQYNNVLTKEYVQDTTHVSIYENENVEAGSTTETIDINFLNNHKNETSETTFVEWRNAQKQDAQKKDVVYTATYIDSQINSSIWLYPVYDVKSGGTVGDNTFVVRNNNGTIRNNEALGTVESNLGTVEVNYGSVTFDTNGVPSVGEVATAKVEKNYGTLINAQKVMLDSEGKVTSDSSQKAKEVYINAPSTAGAATTTLYAITYSQLGILEADLWHNETYAESLVETNDTYVLKTETKTSGDFVNGSTYKVEKGNAASVIAKEDYQVTDFLYWIDVLDNNKIYNHAEISELSAITKSMWLRPVYIGRKPQPGPGGGGTGGGSTGGGTAGGNETPAIPADIPTNTPMTAGDILNDPNMSPETKELLNEILDKNSTGSVIIKDDGTIAVPGPGGIPVDVTIEDDKVSIGTMTKDDIKKAVDSLKNKDSGKTDDKTNDKKDGKSDSKDNKGKLNNAISIDVSVFKGIGQVEINNDTLNNIADSEADGFKTTMSIGSMTLDKPAISGVSGILMGRNLILVVEEMDEGLLSKKQKKVVEESKEDDNYLAVVDSYLLAGNDKIKHLGNGTALLEIKLDALGYKEAAGKAPVVYEIAEDGTKTKIDYEIVDHIITFEVNELSTYLITVE